MRNTLVLTVAVIKGRIVAHFTAKSIQPAQRPTMETYVNAHRTTTVPVPDKLQGADYNLVFPLHKAKTIHHLDFHEIEDIMVLNGVAHNVTSITAKGNGSSTSTDFVVIFNDAQIQP